MALSKLSGDEQCIIFSQLCNTLEPGTAVAFSSTSNELRALSQVLLQQLRADHEMAAALCRKMGMRSCKVLREAKQVVCDLKGLPAADLATLGSLGSVLPALEELHLIESAAGAASPYGVLRLVERLGAGALASVTKLVISGALVGEAAASALAVALGQGALPLLQTLQLNSAAMTTRGWWPSRRPCGGCPLWRLSILVTARSATRASPPSWRRFRQVRRRRRLEC